MRVALCAVALAAALVLPAASQGFQGPRGRVYVDPEATGSVGRAPWNQPWQYDSGSGQDKRPELPYYQQGGGQLTGGPARNLIPQDSFQLYPR